MNEQTHLTVALYGSGLNEIENVEISQEQDLRQTYRVPLCWERH